MNDKQQIAATYGEDARLVEDRGRLIYLVGTAHVSKQSAELVERVIANERPDAVCLELDAKRYQSLTDKEGWRDLNMREIIRRQQVATLLVNLLLASYQKKIGAQLGVTPGIEFLTAARVANDLGIPISLCDREVRVTLRRAWKATTFWQKNKLLAALLASLFDSEQVDEGKLAELRQKDVLTSLVDELGENLPGLKNALIDERDIYLAEKIKATPGKKLVAVIGAGHMPGVIQQIACDNAALLPSIETIPRPSLTWKILGWSIPALIIALLLAIGWRHGLEAVGENALYWILVTGLPAAAGGLLSLGHPLTIMSAFVAAPITTLSPLIGAGHVTALVQAMQAPPLVKEIENVGADIVRVRGWWENRLLRIFLVFFFTSLGASVGVWLGGYRLFASLFS
ncbi:MAG: TraB/GumN family protein [Desulfobulbaceae bacterium]|jgi:pheromone shutdown-related protein TraB|nr:TraB/GumN family protein [Desulfobulbaceae bacterium]